MGAADKIAGAITGNKVNTDTGEKVSGDGAGAIDVNALKAAVSKRDGRGRPSKADADAKAEADKKAEAAKVLYNAKTWGPIAGLYFDIRFVTTGFENFLLDKEEKDELGASLALIMQELIQIDPKWAALMVFSVGMTKTIIKKEITWKVEKNRMIAAQEAEDSKKEKSGVI